MNFNPQVEDTFIREAVSHKLDIPLVNPSNKFWRDSTQTETPSSIFQVSDSLRYNNDGHNYMLYLVDINTNGTYISKYSIKLLIENTIIVTKDFLKSITVPDIG